MKSAALRLFLALFALLALAAPSSASLRISARGVPSFDLPEILEENGLAWYDADAWLSRFPGALERSPDGLSYRQGRRQFTLSLAAPFVSRDGKPLRAAQPPRVVDDQLLVSEKFIRELGSDLLGIEQRIERTRGVEGGRSVVLDPAFGGEVSGDRSSSGKAAKDLLLDFARTLGAALEAAGYEVHLTRNDDTALSAERRAATANYWQADLFLSLQVTGASRPRARGFEIFFPAPPPADADPSRWGNAQAGRAQDSRRWAEALRAALGADTSIPDRGLTALPSPLLNAVAAPAALWVVGNLAWPQEAELLTDAPARDRLAAAVVSAANAYFGGSKR